MYCMDIGNGKSDQADQVSWKLQLENSQELDSVAEDPVVLRERSDQEANVTEEEFFLTYKLEVIEKFEAVHERLSKIEEWMKTEQTQMVRTSLQMKAIEHVQSELASIGRNNSNKQQRPSGTDGELLHGDMSHECHYEMSESVWNAALWLFTPVLVNWVSSLHVFFLVAGNILIQGFLLWTVMQNFTGRQYDDKMLSDLKTWRYYNAHDQFLMSPSYPVSLASRVCNRDASLSKAANQLRRAGNLNSYLGTGFDNGYLLSIFAIFIHWILTMEETMSAVDLVRAMTIIPMSRKTRFMRTSDGFVVNSLHAVRFALAIIIASARIFISGMIMLAGTMWLANTHSLTDVFLNAVSLLFIMDIDEIIYKTLVTMRVKWNMRKLVPLELRPPREWKGLESRSMASLLLTVIGAFCLYYFKMVGILDSLYQANEYLCGGNKDFVAGIDPLGIMRVFPTDTVNDIQRGFDNPRMKAIAEAIENPSDQFSSDQFPIFLLAPNLKVFNWPGTLADYVEESLINQACTDVLSYGNTYYEYMRFWTNASIQSCADLGQYCFGMDDNETSLHFMTRLFCSSTCGCGNWQHGTLLIGEDYGCPRSCVSEMKKELQAQADNDCWEPDSKDTRSNDFFDSWVDFASSEEGSMQFFASGCSALTAIVEEGSNVTKADVCHAQGEFSKFKPLAGLCPVSCDCVDVADDPKRPFCPERCSFRRCVEYPTCLHYYYEELLSSSNTSKVSSGVCSALRKARDCLKDIQDLCSPKVVQETRDFVSHFSDYIFQEFHRLMSVHSLNCTEVLRSEERPEYHQLIWKAWANSDYSKNDPCPGAIDLADISSPFSGTTRNTRNRHRSCGLIGPEQVFFVDVAPGWQIDIGQTSNQYHSVHELRFGPVDGTCPGTAQIVCAHEPHTRRHSWTNYESLSQRFYFILELLHMNYGIGGNFTISWSLQKAPCYTTGFIYEPSHLLPHQPTVEDSASACQDRCDRTFGCGYFSYWQNGDCHLSGIAAHATPGYPLVTAGPATCKVRVEEITSNGDSGRAKWTRLSMWSLEASAAADETKSVDNLKSSNAHVWQSPRKMHTYQWIKLLAPSSVELVGFRVRMSKSSELAESSFKNYRFQSSSNAADWKDVKVGIGENQACCDWQEITFLPMTARYWQLYIVDNYNELEISIAELQVLQVEVACDETLIGTNGEGYRGCQNTALDGKACQLWQSQSAQHGLFGNHSYCRNPDHNHKKTIWCFTSSNYSTWKYCYPLEVCHEFLVGMAYKDGASMCFNSADFPYPTRYANAREDLCYTNCATLGNVPDAQTCHDAVKKANKGCAKRATSFSFRPSDGRCWGQTSSHQIEVDADRISGSICQIATPAPTPAPTPPPEGCYQEFKSTPDDKKYYLAVAGLPTDSWSFPFQVKASNDAHVFLGDIAQDRGYEVVLGGWSNEKSVIRYGKIQGPVVFQMEEKGVVHGNSYVTFEITRINQTLTVKRAGLVLMTYEPMAESVAHIYFMTSNGATGEWKYHTYEGSFCEASISSPWINLGAGCCSGPRSTAAGKLYAGHEASLDACGSKCLMFENCGFMEYGGAIGTWCFVWSSSQQCSTLNAATACGSSGDDGVHTYKLDESQAPLPMPVTTGLFLDLRGGFGVENGTWRNQVSGGPDATVPSGILFNINEKAYLFPGKGEAITVALETNPSKMSTTSWSAWVKPLDYKGTLGWVLSQYRDYGWSRAVTINDTRLGGTSITSGGEHDSGFGSLPLGRWSLVVGVWSKDGSCSIYANVSKYSRSCINGNKTLTDGEMFVIGGRWRYDWKHNPQVLMTDIFVYNRALTDSEVTTLYNGGLPLSQTTRAPS